MKERNYFEWQQAYEEFNISESAKHKANLFDSPQDFRKWCIEWNEARKKVAKYVK